MASIEKYNGLVAAPFTPLDNDAGLNTSLIPEYYKFLEKNGISGAFINGTTGEGVSLTQKEKQLSAERWAACLKNGGRMRIINLVGGTCYEECIENAIFSKECGLSAIAVLAPFFFKPDEGNLAEFITRIGESVTGMPVYYYHIPSNTGVSMPMIGLLKRVSRMLPDFAGIKYSHYDIMDYMSCLRHENSRYDMLWGSEECLLAALAVGAKGFVGSTFNYAAPVYKALEKAFEEGRLEEARDLQNIAMNIVSLLGKYGGIATGKAFMRYLGMDCGRFRLPVKNLTEDMFSEFVKDLRGLSIDNLLSVK